MMEYQSLPNSRSLESEAERVNRYIKEFESWRDDLKPFWEQIDKNQEMYEFFKREETETASNISLNNPFTIVESMVSKLNETNLSVTVRAKGQEGMEEFEQYIASIIKDAVEDPDVAAVQGTFRKKKEMFTRDFFSKGNAVAEIQYCYQTQVEDKKKVVVADNPYVQLLNYKSYIFNPAFQFDSSPVFYLEKYVSWDYLKNREYKETGKKGEKQEAGVYMNLASLRDSLSKSRTEKPTDHPEQQFLAGDSSLSRKVEPIRLLERWEGAKLVAIANDRVIIREAYDPKKLGGSGVLRAMNYKIEGRPYAYGEIDPIYKPVRAQDTVVNQSIEMVNKYLRPSILVSDLDADLEAIIEIMEAGGVAYGNAQGVTNIPTNTPPQAAFQTVANLQQAIERAARWSPYAIGTPSQETDKTAGTMGGIARLQQAAEPNFQVKIDAIEESFAQPIGRGYLKMIARLMAEDESRYGLLQGKPGRWVMATRNVLFGRATVKDLLLLEMITPEEVSPLLAELGVGVREGEDIEEAVVFDIDWLVDVKLDNESAADRQEKAQRELAIIQLAFSLGVPLSAERVLRRQAEKEGFDDFDELMLSEEEQRQMQMAQQAQAAEAASAEMQRNQTDQEHEAAMKMMEADNELRREAAVNQARMDEVY